MSQTFRIVNGDIGYDVRGRPSYISGKDKTGQDLTECTLVPVDDIGFGMGLVELVGVVLDPNEIPSLLQTRVTDGITRFRRLQELNQRLVRTNEEIISSIIAVSASAFDAGNRTDFRFSYAVNTIIGDKIARRGTV